MRKRYLLTGYRVFFGLLGLSAILTEIVTLNERGRFIPSNFFSYFTIESNLFAAVILILSAVILHHGTQSKRLTMLRGANTLNMILVGVIFTLLLSGIKDAEFTAIPWDNIVLHYIMPVVVALDWFIDLPQKRITFRKALVWLLFPTAYVVYSLVRGHLVNWYAYPFFNPDTNGYMSVIVTSVVIAIGATGLVWLLTRFTRRDTAKKTA